MSYDRLTQESPVDTNIALLAKAFPSVVREGKVDFDALRQLLGNDIGEPHELYGLNWKGKAQARRAALTPSLGTLRPCPEESVDWDNTKNLYIEGDNLEVLKLLRKSYSGKVKMIYIDPPYNTGNEFVYRDDYVNNLDNYIKITHQSGQFKKNQESNGRFHTDWLNMMYPRLSVAKDLLKDDGVIVISIDENEVENLKVICNEVFGEVNYAGEIIWKNSSKNDQSYISIQHEYMIFYVKNKSHNPGDWYVEKEGLDIIFKKFAELHKENGNNWKKIHEEAQEWYKQFPPSSSVYDSKHYSWMDERGVYFPADISGPNRGQYVYDIIHPFTHKVCKAPASGWRYPEDTMKEKIANNLIHFGADETTVPNNKTYLNDTKRQHLSSVVYLDGRAASKRLSNLMGGNYFTNPKDEQLILKIIKAISSQENDIIMDFFAGSSTTAHSILMSNLRDHCKRRFILVQIQENLVDMMSYSSGTAKAVIESAINFLTKQGKPHFLTEIGKERIRRAGKKLKEEAGLTGQGLDTGFRVYKLDSSNVKPWDPDAEDLGASLDLFSEHLVEGRTSDDLLTEVMLKSGIDLCEEMETREIAGNRVYSLGYGQFYACMDLDLSGAEGELALGIAAWHAEECAAVGGEQQDTCTVFVADQAFAGRDDAKMNFVSTLQQYGICNVKAL